jgi:hypothetical protein
MSPGGLNSVGCGESGVAARVLAGLPGFADVSLDDEAELVVGVDEVLLVELHPARAMVDTVAAAAARVRREVDMCSTLRNGFPAEGKHRVSVR